NPMHYGGGLKARCSTTHKVTGPSRPEVRRGESFVQCFHVVNVRRPVGLGLPSSSHWGHFANGRPEPLQSVRHWQSSGSCSSPMSRFGQRLTTLTSSLFSPGLTALEISASKGAFHRMPKSRPLTFSSAITSTLPRSRYSLRFAAMNPDG